MSGMINFAGRAALNLTPSARSRSVLCEDFFRKRQQYTKAYDDLHFAVQSAMLACRKRQNQEDRPITAASTATKLSRPRGRPQGSKDTKPRSKKRSTAVDVCTSTYPASPMLPSSNTDMPEDPPSFLNTRSFADDGGVKQHEGMTCADSWSLLQQELEPTFCPTSGIESIVSTGDNVLRRHTSSQREMSHDAVAAAWRAGVACDPACWDLPLPC
jgi:hypothetical protein